MTAVVPRSARRALGWGVALQGPEPGPGFRWAEEHCLHADGRRLRKPGRQRRRRGPDAPATQLTCVSLCRSAPSGGGAPFPDPRSRGVQPRTGAWHRGGGAGAGAADPPRTARGIRGRRVSPNTTPPTGPPDVQDLRRPATPPATQPPKATRAFRRAPTPRTRRPRTGLGPGRGESRPEPVARRPPFRPGRQPRAVPPRAGGESRDGSGSRRDPYSFGDATAPGPPAGRHTAPQHAGLTVGRAGVQKGSPFQHL